MLIVFFSVIMGAMGLGQMFSVNPEFAKGRVAAYDLITLIKRKPLIDPNTEHGIKGVELEGKKEEVKSENPPLIIFFFRFCSI